ncbi:hypothetical protein DFJ73DRAFT_827444 [Zopfochytrium polystomum]|nr:hypothetical protein DFJ73DRAFT_827444 [Zopfochytrium polystomum]
MIFAAAAAPPPPLALAAHAIASAERSGALRPDQLSHFFALCSPRLPISVSADPIVVPDENLALFLEDADHRDGLTFLLQFALDSGSSLHIERFAHLAAEVLRISPERVEVENAQFLQTISAQLLHAASLGVFPAAADAIWPCLQVLMDSSSGVMLDCVSLISESICTAPARPHVPMLGVLAAALERRFDELTADSVKEIRMLCFTLLRLAVHILFGLFDGATADDATNWDALLHRELAQPKGASSEDITRIWTAAWKTWSILHELWEVDPDFVADIVPVVSICGTICALIEPSLAVATVRELSVTIRDLPVLPEELGHAELYMFTAEALGVLAQHRSDMAESICEFFLQILTGLEWTEDAAEIDGVDSFLRNCFLDVLVKYVLGNRDAGRVKSALFSFINALQDTSLSQLEHSVADFKKSSFVSAIAKISPVLKTKQVIEVAIPALVKVLYDEDHHLSKAVWENLGYIGKSCGTEVFKDIFSLISTGKAVPIGEIGSLLSQNKPMSKVLFQGVLGLFLDSALATKHTATSDVLLQYAQILKHICDDEAFSIEGRNDIIHTLRNFWLVVTLYVYCPYGNWPETWLPSLLSIATKTPALLLPKEKRNLEADLVSNSILRALPSDQTSAHARTIFATFITKQPSEIKAFSNTIVIFLLSVAQVESLRLRHGSLRCMMQYLTDERFYNCEFWPLLRLIGDKVVGAFLGARQIQKVYIVETLTHLFMEAASRLPAVRQFSADTAIVIMRAIPSMFWEKKLIFLLIDLVQYLEYKVGKEEPALVSRVGHKLTFVDDTDREAASRDYRQFCSQLLSSALAKSAPETGALLQSYMVDIHLSLPHLMGNQSNVFTILGQLCSKREVAQDVLKTLNTRAQYLGEIRGMMRLSLSAKHDSVASFLKHELRSLQVQGEDANTFVRTVSPILNQSAAYIVSQEKVDEELIHLVCWTPFLSFSPASIDMAVPLWTWIMTSRPDLNARILSDMLGLWEWSIYQCKGIYDPKLKSASPFKNKMTYAPSIPPEVEEDSAIVHLKWLQFLSSRFKNVLWHNKENVNVYFKFIQIALVNVRNLRTGPSVRHAIIALLHLGSNVGAELERNKSPVVNIIWHYIFDAAFALFSVPPRWSTFRPGEADLVKALFKDVKACPDFVATTTGLRFLDLANGAAFTNRVSTTDAKTLLLDLLDNDVTRVSVWESPLSSAQEAQREQINAAQIIRVSFSIKPAIASHIPKRFIGYTESITYELGVLCAKYPVKSMHISDLIPAYLAMKLPNITIDARHLLYWDPVTPVTAITLLGPKYKSHPWVLQYAVRSLEHFPVDQVFFYIPQMVQALRYDQKGYVEMYLLKTARVSQLFAHQIIWNMNANMLKMYKEKGEEKTAPDSIKPLLERITDKIIAGMLRSDKEFYEREFSFFSKVTGISGTLKPYIQRSKEEKKKKIDEEMRKIKVDVGVYLPSNPESTVLDIDYDSGRPLQSHAKAPFMATFKIRRELESTHENDTPKEEIIWQSAIFKVGDDCRQDILALQLVSIFKSIFASTGLDVYLFPYRVVSTAPGCGIIEVLPRSISRDIIGREKVNSLPNYFLEKFGTVDSYAFRNAQNAFIRSLAAYSLILYIVQIKDRHNGNIMFDDQGHILHIDFGFILDISPGGIEFEASPFKLTTEMIDILGGDANTRPYKLFSELIVKSFLAIRPYAEEIVHMVSLMLDSGLPCFKGEQTIEKLRKRFQLGKTDKAAAEFMVAQIRASHENKFSRMYDRFQNFQNGIPF